MIWTASIATVAARSFNCACIRQFRPDDCEQHFQIHCSVPGLGWNRTGTVATGFTPSRNRTAPNRWIFGWFHNFANSEHWLQLSIWVLIVSQYDIYVIDADLHGLSPTVPHLAIQSIFVESVQKTPNFWRYFTGTRRILIGLQIGE